MSGSGGRTGGGAVMARRWDPEVFVAAPRSEVFAYLADPRNRPAWQRTLASVEILEPERAEAGPYVGLRWVDHVKVGPPFELVISAMRPDELWAEVGRTGPFTAYGTLLFSDATRDGVAGTRVRLVARVEAAGPARPLGWGATAVAAALVRDDLRRAARILGGR